jgi:hypothetical protein
MVAILLAVIIAGCTLASGSTEANAVEELVFISDPADAPAVQAAGFDGVVYGGMIHRFARPGADQPYFDEPEDRPDTSLFFQWWAQYGATGLVLHWNPAKANMMGVWENPPTVSWNWYPATRWTPEWAWSLYIPLQFRQYRAYITASNAYGTLQAVSGWDEAPLPGESKPLDYFYPSDELMTTMRQQFRDGLGASFRGYLWFMWSGPNLPDSLSMHPNWWPVNRAGNINPTLALGLNQSSFRTGGVLSLTATVAPGATPSMVDVYVALSLPGGSLLFLQGDGSLTSVVQPIVRNWTVGPFSGQIFSYTFSGGEPGGNYTWQAAFAAPGTLNLLGPIVSVPFNFSP